MNVIGVVREMYGRGVLEDGVRLTLKSPSSGLKLTIREELPIFGKGLVYRVFDPDEKAEYPFGRTVGFREAETVARRIGAEQAELGLRAA
jgi:hypothetical protein